MEVKLNTRAITSDVPGGKYCFEVKSVIPNWAQIPCNRLRICTFANIKTESRFGLQRLDIETLAISSVIRYAELLQLGFLRDVVLEV